MPARVHSPSARENSMRSRLIPIFAVAAISAALLAAQERPAQQPPGTLPGGQPGAKAGAPGSQPGSMTSLDGDWTVVSASRDGKAVEGADKMTVHIKGNVVTFAGAPGGADKQMHALRLDFGPRGVLRVTEAGADGKFGTGGDRPGGTGTPPPGGGTTTRPGGTGTTQPGGTGTQPGGIGGTGAGGLGEHGMLSGVYVLTPDYFAVSVFTTSGLGSDRPGGLGTPGGERPGGLGTPPPTGTNPGGTTRPGGTGTTQPGGTGTQPGGTGTGTQPGGGIGAGGLGGTMGGPDMHSHLSVILKKGGR